MTQCDSSILLYRAKRVLTKLYVNLSLINVAVNELNVAYNANIEVFVIHDIQLTFKTIQKQAVISHCFYLIKLDACTLIIY